MELLERSEYQLYFFGYILSSKLCWQLRKKPSLQYHLAPDSFCESQKTKLCQTKGLTWTRRTHFFSSFSSSKASSELWVYHLLCPLKLIHCLSHKCFFHLPWHLTGPSFNSVTFHHPAGSTWVQLESHLNANRPSTEAVNLTSVEQVQSKQRNLLHKPRDTHDHWG